jgi:hypothetical protein
MSEENNTNETQTQEQPQATAQPKTDEIIDVEWEELSQIFFKRKQAMEAENYLARTIIQHEKRKLNLLDNMAQLESSLYQEALVLRESLDVSSEVTYELKLPNKEGEKGYFIRKQED